MSHATDPPPPVVVDREFGPLPRGHTRGVAHDGRHLWVATGEHMHALEPERGQVVRTLAVTSDAGTAFDGQHLYQLTRTHIQKVDPGTGEILGTIPAPGEGLNTGLTWAEGMLWVGQFHERKIHRVDPATGEITRTLASDRFVTGVTWTGGELWHGTWEDEASELRRVDPETGEVLERHAAPEGTAITGLSSDGTYFYCGTGSEGRVRALRRRE